MSKIGGPVTFDCFKCGQETTVHVLMPAVYEAGRAAALNAWEEWAETEWTNGNLTGSARERAEVAIDALREGADKPST